MFRPRRPLAAASYQAVDSEEYEILEHEGHDAQPETILSGVPELHNRIQSSSNNNNVGSMNVTHSPSAAVPSSGVGSWPGLSNNASPSSSSFTDRKPQSTFRAVSCEGVVPLSHPTPDLQSLQGAYVGNIERLEQSAERISLSSSDIGEGVRKLQLEQKIAESRRASSREASLQKRQVSSNSNANSIIGVNNVARTGGFSPEAYVASPTGSLMSSPWLVHSGEERSPTSPPPPLPPEHRVPLQDHPQEDVSSSIQASPKGRLVVRNTYEESLLQAQTASSLDETQEVQHDGSMQGPHRPGSAGSGDTFKRPDRAFSDFDGVHIEPSVADETDYAPPPQSTNQATSFGLPAPQAPFNNEQTQYPAVPENLVYYPAPVPMMLSLPKKLSAGQPTSRTVQNRADLLNRAQGQARRSTIVISEAHNQDGNQVIPGNLSKLPPQLRASVFFEQAPIPQNIQIEGGSAVMTFDSVLDASAFAPVNAFVDHPIVGSTGAKIYSRSAEAKNQNKPKQSNESKRKSVRLLQNEDLEAHGPTRTDVRSGIPDQPENKASYNELHNGVDEAGEDDETTPLRQSLDAYDAEHNSQAPHDTSQDHEAEETEEGIEKSEEKPSTLLAELQMRKAQQKQRNRTAVAAFPQGMHSTLLEMDAVAHVQKQARKQKQVTLAWEDPESAEVANSSGDEDVPLGVLYPNGKAQKQDPAARVDDFDRPLGLIAQRAMEDNEPLSHRRARLRGEPFSTSQPPVMNQGLRSSRLDLPAPRLPGLGEPDEEEETLAQRRERLMGVKTLRKDNLISDDFASEMMVQFGGASQERKNSPPVLSKTPDGEETLGQRRKRLQAAKKQQELARSREVSSESALTKEQPPAPKRHSFADLLQGNPVGAPEQNNFGVSQNRLGPGISQTGLLAAAMNGWPSSGRTGHQRPASGSPYNVMPPQQQQKVQLQELSRFDTFPVTNHEISYANAKPSVARRSMLYANPVATHSVSYVNPMAYTPMIGLVNAGGSANQLAYPQTAPIEEYIPLDARQRDMIDQWRQNVV